MDIAVIGAGPAGAWAAYRLAKRGARVTIFDPSHPREKACGGGVSGRALALVEEAIARHSVPTRAITAARFTMRGRSSDAVVPLAPSALAVASRREFDEAVLAAAVRAGAVLRQSRVVDVQTTAVGIRVITADDSVSAGFVVGADGANSLVRRRLGHPFRRDQLSIATGYFARGITSDEIQLELAADPAGYLWCFPRPDHLAIGVCAQADGAATAAALRVRCSAWIDDRRLAPNARLEPYSWPIPSLAARDFSSQRITGDRWCLAGDAAGLVDPVTREGIYFALASGQWAADAIAGARAATSDYMARLNDEAIPELSTAARLKSGFFRPAFCRLLMTALDESEGVRRVMADLIAGTQSYRTLQRRLLQTFEFRLAWRALRTWRAAG